MENMYRKDLPDFSDNDLFSIVRNPIHTDKNRLNEIIDELKKRGYAEQIEKLEQDLILRKPVYAKFWNRIGAYLIDVLVLGITGFILGLFFKDLFADMGSQGLMVGFVISLVYFGLGNSKICKGQTVGKGVLKLQVVNKNLDLLTVQKSIVRALIYTVPYFFLNFKLSGWSELSVLYIAKGIVFLSFLIVLPVHLILNTPTRQALHDLLLGTYVVSMEAYPRQELRKSRVLPIYLAGLVLIVVMGIALFFSLKNSNMNNIVHELTPIKEKIDKISEVRNSSITRSRSSVKKFGSDSYISKSEYVSLDIILKDNLISNIRLDNIEDLGVVKDAVRIILKDYRDVNKLNYIQVNLIYGYNIGINKSYQSMSFRNTVENWIEKTQ